MHISPRPKTRIGHPAWQRQAMVAALTAIGTLSAGSAQAIVFYSYASTSGNPGPNGRHIFRDSGPVPAETASAHFGQRNLPHDSGLISSLATVDAQAFARADMGGLHLDAHATGVLRDAQPYRSETFAASANARAALGDSFRIQPLNPLAVFATTSMTLGFRVDALMTGYAYSTPLDPLNPGGGEGRSRWHADFAAYDDSAGIELGRITLDQSCAMSTSYNFTCFGDLPGVYVLNISAPFGHTLSVSLNGETWASVLGAQGRGGDILAGGQADLRHTMAWGGITHLRDENGQAIAGFTAMRSIGWSQLFRGVSTTHDNNGAPAYLACAASRPGIGSVLSDARKKPGTSAARSPGSATDITHGHQPDIGLRLRQRLPVGRARARQRGADVYRPGGCAQPGGPPPTGAIGRCLRPSTG